MKLKLLLIAALLFTTGAGQAESEKKETGLEATTTTADVASKPETGAAVEEGKQNSEDRCLASEEIIKDIEAREAAIKQKETQFAEREKEIEAQKVALKEEMAKLETMRAEIQGIRGRELAANEEKVNKLIETFEGMSPKSAAAVLAKVDEELAVTALSRLSTVKAGKILGQLDPVKSSQLSEMIAFGPNKKGKEKANGESNQRAPAAAKQ